MRKKHLHRFSKKQEEKERKKIICIVISVNGNKNFKLNSIEKYHNKSDK